MINCKPAIFFLGVFLLVSCNKKKEIDLGIEGPKVSPTDCKITSNSRSDGQQYQYIFDNNKILNIMGFNDFDTFVYTAGKITKAYSTKNKNAQILFDFDDKSLLKKITFEGKDSQGKSFSYPTTITHNNINKIDKLILSWPTFNGKIETRFSYDVAGNIKFISAFLDNQWVTVLENTEFDDKPSPYKNQQIGQILSYYMVYSVLGPGLNFTHYINANNVKKSIVKKGNDKINYEFSYIYNAQGYPSEMNYTRTINNRPTPGSEKFSYDCDK
jgi:hypothetical protein